MDAAERMTITLPADVAAFVKSAVATGDYVSTSDVIQSALLEWKTKRISQSEDLSALQSDIEVGLADLAAGRVEDFDTGRIVARGRIALAKNSSSG